MFALDNNTLVSASRDRSVKVWRRSAVDVPFVLDCTLNGHSHFVNCIGYLKNNAYIEPPISAASNSTQQSGGCKGWLVTGGMDKLVLMWDLANHNDPVFTLIGHTDSVCAVHCNSSTGQIVTASWDKTARVWRDGKCEFVLTGHEYAVWAVLSISSESNKFVTGIDS